MDLIFPMIFGMVLVGLGLLPKLIRTQGWLIVSCIGVWALCALAITAAIYSAPKVDGQIVDRGDDGEADWPLQIGIAVLMAFGFTVGSIPRGLELLMRRKSSISRLSWPIGLAGLFLLPLLPFFIYGH